MTHTLPRPFRSAALLFTHHSDTAVPRTIKGSSLSHFPRTPNAGCQPMPQVLRQFPFRQTSQLRPCSCSSLQACQSSSPRRSCTAKGRTRWNGDSTGPCNWQESMLGQGRAIAQSTACPSCPPQIGTSYQPFSAAADQQVHWQEPSVELPAVVLAAAVLPHLLVAGFQPISWYRQSHLCSG